MNASDANRQIQQMIAFIKQEAKEKAEEIEVKTESACTAEKLSMTMQLGMQIREEFERKKKDVSIQKKIERSKLVNDARLSTMKSRDVKVKGLKSDVLQSLANVSSNPKYAELCRLLIVEGAMKMHEKTMYVQCRKEDEAMIKKEIKAAEKTYSEVMTNASGVPTQCQLVLDEKDYLPSGPAPGKTGASCCGGVVLHANHKKMICRNTLDSRLDIAMENLTPQIRGLLFGFPKPPGAQ